MKHVSIIYWSGSGNTEQLAQTIQKNLQDDSVNVRLELVDKISVDEALHADALFLGCPSMGAEVLEEGDMEPFVEALCASPSIKGKPVALFGSYDWGDGQWMRDWEDRMKASGANLVSDGLIYRLEPDQNAMDAAKSLSKHLVASIG